MKKIEDLKAYSVVKKEDLPEVQGTGYILTHNKTKARVALVLNEDSNKVFTIGFRTPPADDTGVPHITEHSVLCGSKKFPVKDPFIELAKGSLNTFLNAMTYSDKTVYPVASLNKKDFHNLMHVYLDAVFYPDIYKHPEIMMQEGWHYEYDEEADELSVNGVVYNEMKGVYSSSEQQLYRIIQSSLLPDTAYACESGGDPVAIPNLTQEAFIDFHSKYYHPSNSYIYLYGDMDAAEELAFIDEEYLSSFDYLAIDSSLTDAVPFEEPKYVNDYYSLADAEDEKDNTYLTYNVLTGSCLDKKLETAMGILEYVLVNMPGAPLKKALIDANIGKDILSSYDGGIRQTLFSVIAKNANAEDEEKFINIINSTLEGLVANKIDEKTLTGAINNFEFKHKEANFGRYPKGLMLGLNAFTPWLHDDMAALDVFSLNDVYEELKKEVSTGYFENLIKEYFLDNKHKTFVKLMPKKGLFAMQEEEQKKKLAAYKETLSKDELKAIAAQAKHLKEYQSEPSSEEALKTIPMLDIDDIDKKTTRELHNDFYEIEKVEVVHHDIFTNGISYIGMYFDISDLDFEKLPYVSLLTEIFKYVDTEKYTYNELANEINYHLGSVGFSTGVINLKDLDAYKAHMIISAKMLDNKVDKGFELIDEILFTSKIDDKKRLKEIIAEAVANLKDGLLSAGHTTAYERAISYQSEMGVAKELLEGVDYFKFLNDLEKNFEDKYDDLVENLKMVLGEVLCRGHLSVSYTSKQDVMSALETPITALSNKLSTRLDYDAPKRIVPVKKNEGFKSATQVQYVATAGNFRRKGLEYTGALEVLTSIFSYDYLWNNVRVKGGAYGSMCGFARSGNSYLTSYRDPNLMETYEIYMNAPEYVRNFEASDRDMLKYIIGAISKLDTPKTPSAEGILSYISYLVGLTVEEFQKERDEVLSANVETIRSLAPYVEAAVSEGIICAIGDENKMEAAKENFGEVISVF